MAIKKCTMCLKIYKMGNNVHECGKQFCKNCNKFVMSDHFCYINPNEKCPHSIKETLFVFYDLETRQEKNMSKHKIHEPILCVYVL